MRGSDGAPISDDIVRALEVLGIAEAVDARFDSTPQHDKHTTLAVFEAGMLSDPALSWFSRRDAGAGVRGLGESDDGYRAFLLTHLDWVHNYGTVHDGATTNASTCLCPGVPAADSLRDACGGLGRCRDRRPRRIAAGLCMGVGAHEPLDREAHG